jgi:hypothetical protein
VNCTTKINCIWRSLRKLNASWHNSPGSIGNSTPKSALISFRAWRQSVWFDLIVLIGWFSWC